MNPECSDHDCYCTGARKLAAHAPPGEQGDATVPRPYSRGAPFCPYSTLDRRLAGAGEPEEEAEQAVLWRDEGDQPQLLACSYGWPTWPTPAAPSERAAYVARSSRVAACIRSFEFGYYYRYPPAPLENEQRLRMQCHTNFLPYVRK